MLDLKKLIFLTGYLKKEKLTISSVESVTGGKFASGITSISGASNYFYGSMIVYNEESKINLLNISKETIDTYGTISNEVSLLMAQNFNKLANTDITISFTGNAGPNCIEGKDCGLTYISIVTKNGKSETYEYVSPMEERNKIISDIVNHSIDLLIVFLRKI